MIAARPYTIRPAVASDSRFIYELAMDPRIRTMSTRQDEFTFDEHERWFIESHQFRIDTTDGIGRPTPEGAHRDGVDLVAVILVGREGVKGGETRIFEATGPSGQRFTLTEPWSVMLLDDARMIHETTPIQPEQPGGVRDTLVLTYRRQGFQGSELTRRRKD